MQQQDDALRDASLSGGASGAALGAGSAFLENMSRKQLLKRILLGGLGGAALSGGSIGLGHEMLGDPEDESAYTRSGAIGGITLGGGLGALGTWLLSKKYLRAPGIKEGIVKNLIDLPPGKAALGGAAIGGAAGAFQGSGEGMQLDFIKNEMDRLQKKKLHAQMSGNFTGEINESI